MAVSAAIDSAPSTEVRRECVDGFRGIILAQLLIGPPLIVAVASLSPTEFRDVVNQELHPSIWHGLTWVDFDFAACVMVIGLGISLQSRSRIGKSAPNHRYLRILGQTALLFFLGLIDNGLFSHRWSDLRIAGFLQRIAVCYLVGSILFLLIPKRVRYAILGAILVGYWLLIAYVPVPGGVTDGFSFEGNLAAWVDRQFLPGSALYGKWDPDGILTTIPAIASCLFGMVWGDILLSKMSSNNKLLWLLLGGLVSTNLGFLADSVFPINRSLWSSSYVLVTGGIGSIVLGLCYLFVDLLSLGRWLFPFVVMGHHFLIAFLVIEMLPKAPIVQRIVSSNLAIVFGRFAPFVESATECLGIWLLLYGLYQYQTVVKKSRRASRVLFGGESFDE